MLFTKRQNLAEMMVSFLTYHPGATLVEMQTAIDPLVGKAITRQGWYKAIRQLLKAEVIVKVKKKYYINVAWASHLTKLAYFIESNYLKLGRKHEAVLPNLEKQKIKYNFPDLLKLDSFWAHVLVLIAARYPGTPFYAYNPHFWYFAAHQFEAEKCFESMKRYKAGNYTIVGARTDLDLWSEKLHPPKISHYYCSPRPIFKNDQEYILVMAEYYMSVRISQKMASGIDKLFRQTKLALAAPEPPLEVVNFFKQKSPCTMTIIKDADKCAKFARKIRRYF